MSHFIPFTDFCSLLLAVNGMFSWDHTCSAQRTWDIWIVLGNNALFMQASSSMPNFKLLALYWHMWQWEVAAGTWQDELLRLPGYRCQHQPTSSQTNPYPCVYTQTISPGHSFARSRSFARGKCVNLKKRWLYSSVPAIAKALRGSKGRTSEMGSTGDHSRFCTEPCANMGQDQNTSLSCFANSITKQRGRIQPRDTASHPLNFQLLDYSNWALQNCPRLPNLSASPRGRRIWCSRMHQHSWLLAVIAVNSSKKGQRHWSEFQGRSYYPQDTCGFEPIAEYISPCWKIF